jgi:hypothetical protein
MSTLSVCTIAQDEEEPIQWYLEYFAFVREQLGDLLKEVVIVDGGSQDRTVEVIKSYQDRIPIKLLERPFDCTREQQNFGLDHCTGDFIFGLDADMTATANFPAVFKSGLFEQGAYWDFPMRFSARDAFHYFYKWPQGVNMRLWKRGPKWKQERKFHVQLEGQTQGIPICPSVVIFENSCRITNDKALMWRGERRQKCEADIAAEGASPGAPDRFYNAAHSPDEDIAILDSYILPLVLPYTNIAKYV